MAAADITLNPVTDGVEDITLYTVWIGPGNPDPTPRYPVIIYLSDPSIVAGGGGVKVQIQGIGVQ